MDPNTFERSYQKTRAKYQNEPTQDESTKQKERDSFTAGWNAYKEYKGKIQSVHQAREIAEDLTKNKMVFSYEFFVDGFVEASTTDSDRK